MTVVHLTDLINTSEQITGTGAPVSDTTGADDSVAACIDAINTAINNAPYFNSQSLSRNIDCLQLLVIQKNLQDDTTVSDAINAGLQLLSSPSTPPVVSSLTDATSATDGNTI